MRRTSRLALVALAVSALCGARCSSPFAKAVPDTVTIVSYNVHNLFDDVDTGNEYPEFDMDTGKWTRALYLRRMDNLAEAVASLEPGYPDVLCMQELESEKVLADLAAGALKKAGYRHVAAGGPDGSSIRSGVLSRLPILRTRRHSVADAWGFGPARDMLETVLDRGGGRKLIVFTCHWKSRREGEEETEVARRVQAGLAAARVAAALEEDPEAEIVVCGDFNESPDEYERVGRRYATALMPADAASGGILLAGGGAASPVLHSPWASAPGYSYRYRGVSERLDGFLLSRALCDGAGLDIESFAAADAGFLRDERGDPFAWNGSSGYSDHLPVRLRLAVLSADPGTGTLR